MRSLKNIFFISKITISKKEFIFLISIFVLGIILRIIYLNDYRKIKFYYPVLENSDSYYYLKWAEDISKGDIIGKKVFMKWPFYAYFLAVLLKVFDYNLLYIYLFQFILGCLNIILIYVIARKLFGKLVGICSVLFYLSYGLFIFYEGLLLYTGLSVFINLVLFLYLLYIKDNITKKRLFLVGIFLGISTLIQANAVIFGVLAVLIILLEKKFGFKRFFCNIITFILGLIIVIFPITLRNYLLEKDWVLLLGHLGFNFYLGNNPYNPKGIFYYPFYINPNQESMFRDARILAELQMQRRLKTSEVSRFWFRKALSFIKKNPFFYLKTQLNKLIYLFAPTECIHDWEFFGIKDRIRLFRIIPLDLSFIVVLFYIGFILGIKRLKENYLPYLALFSFSFSIIFFFVATRYRIVIVPFMIIFASLGMVRIVDWFFQKRYLRFLIFLILALIINVFGLSIKRDERVSRDAKLVNHLERIMYYREKFDYRSFLKEVENAYNLEPENPLLLNMLGEAYYKLNDFEKAKEIYKKIIIKYPFFVDAYYNLGLIYNKQGFFKEAEEILARAVLLDPEDIQAHFELGRAYKYLGEKEKAKKEFWFVLNRIDLTDREVRKKIEEELFDLVER